MVGHAASRKLAGAVTAAALFAALGAGLAGCGAIAQQSLDGDAMMNTSDTSGGVAATVNGVEIGENAVTAYIQQFRTYQGIEEDSAWIEWMQDNGLTCESVREQTVDYYIGQELLRQAAQQEGVSVDSSQVEEQLESMRSAYGSEEAWQEYLESVATTENVQRELIELSLMQEGLVEAIAGDVTASDDDVLNTVASYASQYDGAKRSSQILFSADDSDTAQEVLERINSGELDFADAVSEYSIDTASAENGGDVGWDCMQAFIDEYQDALDELEPGQVSGLVITSYGIHIIMCIDELVAPEGGVTSLDQVSEGFVESVRDIVDANEKNIQFNAWMMNFEDESDIQITDMPNGLPYYVDMPESDSSESDGSDETSDSESGDSGDKSDSTASSATEGTADSATEDTSTQ